MSQKKSNHLFQAFFASPKGRRLSLWLAFFVYWGGVAAVLPFLGVFYESIHLSGRQIGQLNSIPFFISLLSSVTFGFLSDFTRRYKLLLRVCALGMIGALFLYPQVRGFAAFFPVVLMYAIFNAPANPILDETSLVSLEDPAKYGLIRLSGSLGWGVIVLVTGILIDQLGLGLPIIFYIHIAFLVLFLMITFIMPKQRALKQTERERISLKELGQVLSRPGFITILFLIVIWGIAESSIQNFLFLHIKFLGGSSTLMGTALSVSLIGEIVIFAMADKIQKRLGSSRMMLAAFLVMFSWLIGLSLIKNPTIIPLFQVFGGAGFALIQSGSVAYVNQHAPRQLGTTAQAVRGGVLSGLGVGVGTLVSGFIYELVGSVALYRIMSAFSAAGFSLGLWIYFKERRKHDSAQI